MQETPGLGPVGIWLVSPKHRSFHPWDSGSVDSLSPPLYPSVGTEPLPFTRGLKVIEHLCHILKKRKQEPREGT